MLFTNLLYQIYGFITNKVAFYVHLLRKKFVLTLNFAVDFKQNHYANLRWLVRAANSNLPDKQQVILRNSKLFWQATSQFEKQQFILTNSMLFWQKASYFDKQQVNLLAVVIWKISSLIRDAQHTWVIKIYRYDILRSGEKNRNQKN